MSTPMRWLAILAGCAYPLLNHGAAVFGEPRLAALGLALLTWAFVAGAIRLLPAILLAAGVLLLSLWLAAVLPGWLLYSPPVALNLALCALFALTLRAGKDPLVSRFARIERGGVLPPDLVSYTRNLTLAWAGFFALMAAISLALALAGPLALWSLFSNIVNYVLVVVFFVLEYLYRRIRYRHHPHTAPWQLIRRLHNYRPFARPADGN